MTDAQLVTALADLSDSQTPERRAAHLVRPGRELAERLRAKEPSNDKPGGAG